MHEYLQSAPATMCKGSRFARSDFERYDRVPPSRLRMKFAALF
jgi:hypothetical protein